MDHVSIDLVCNFAGEIRRPIRQTFTGKRGRTLDAEKRRQHGRDENCSESFHLLSLRFVSIELDSARVGRIRINSKKLRVESGRALVNVRGR